MTGIGFMNGTGSVSSGFSGTWWEPDPIPDYSQWKLTWTALPSVQVEFQFSDEERCPHCEKRIERCPHCGKPMKAKEPEYRKMDWPPWDPWISPYEPDGTFQVDFPPDPETTYEYTTVPIFPYHTTLGTCTFTWDGGSESR